MRRAVFLKFVQTIEFDDHDHGAWQAVKENASSASGIYQKKPVEPASPPQADEIISDNIPCLNGLNPVLRGPSAGETRQKADQPNFVVNCLSF
jgi:hypothetical protein